MIPIAEYILLTRTFWGCQSYWNVFSYYYTIWKVSIEIENDQAKSFVMLVGLELVIEREHCRKRTRNVTAAYKMLSRPIT